MGIDGIVDGLRVDTSTSNLVFLYFFGFDALIVDCNRYVDGPGVESTSSLNLVVPDLNEELIFFDQYFLLKDADTLCSPGPGVISSNLFSDSSASFGPLPRVDEEENPVKRGLALLIELGILYEPGPAVVPSTSPLVSPNLIDFDKN